MLPASYYDSLESIDPRNIDLSMLDQLSGGADVMGALDDLRGKYSGAVTPWAEGAQRGIRGATTKIPVKMGGAAINRMAASPGVLKALKLVPAVGALGGVLGAGDVLLGDDSAGNKVMDGTAMTIGGILGAAGGPVGIAAGAGAGKMVSDAGQWLFGDKKSAEQRRMEEALRQLRGVG